MKKCFFTLIFLIVLIILVGCVPKKGLIKEAGALSNPDDNVVALSPGICLETPASLRVAIKQVSRGKEYVVRLADKKDGNIHISVRGSFYNNADLERMTEGFLTSLAKTEFSQSPFYVDATNPPVLLEGITVEQSGKRRHVIFVVIPREKSFGVLIIVYNRVEEDLERLKTILTEFLGGLRIS